MIFISGIHGVGKSYFCNIVKEKLGIKSYSASTLIAEAKKQSFSPDKLVSGIDENQLYLLAAVNRLRESDENFILDGHFCLLNTDGKVVRIGVETFTTLKPDTIILLTEKPEVIAARRKERDGVELNLSEIQHFQNAETLYAQKVAQLLGAKLKISAGSSDLDATIDFIQSL